MSTDFNAKISQAINTMTQDHLRELAEKDTSFGDSRFTVTKDGTLTIITGPLKRDNCVVRFFKGLSNPEYREMNRKVALAKNADFQRRITEKAVSLFAGTSKSISGPEKGGIAGRLGALLAELAAKQQGLTNRTGLFQAFKISDQLDNAMRWGASLAWIETREPDGEDRLSHLLDSAPAHKLDQLRAQVDLRVRAELSRETGVDLLLARAAMTFNRGGLKTEARDEALAMFQRKTSGVLQALSVQCPGQTAEQRVDRMLAALKANPTGESPKISEVKTTVPQHSPQTGTEAPTKLKPWHNRTVNNKAGVCEAAVTMWFGQLIDGKTPLASVPTAPEKCDGMQTMFNHGDSNWTSAIAAYVREQSTTSRIILFSGEQEDYQRISIKSPRGYETNAQTFKQLADGLEDGGFAFLSASHIKHDKIDGVGHAIGLFKSGADFYVFDPNQGLFKANAQQIGPLLTEVTKSWNRVEASLGHIPPAN